MAHLCQSEPLVPAWTLQQEFAASHPWFHLHRLQARGHLPPLRFRRRWPDGSTPSSLIKPGFHPDTDS
jgi:hypothetical protein